MFKRIRNWCNTLKERVLIEETEFNAEAAAVLKKEQLFDLFNQYFNDKETINKNLVEVLYILSGRSDQFSLRGITDEDLIAALQIAILKRDFN